MIPSIYINLDDDVARVVARLKKTPSEKVVLVCPKRCQLFSDSINLRLLKKQVDFLKKEVFILTMDERGQIYAKEAGFELKFLPKGKNPSSFSDIQVRHNLPAEAASDDKSWEFAQKAKEAKKFVSGLASFAKKDVAGKTAELSEKFSVSGKKPSPKLTGKKVSTSGPKITKDPIFSQNKFTDELLASDPGYFLPDNPEDAEKPKKRWLFSISLAASLVVVLALIFVVLPAAAVEVYPKTEPVTRDFDVTFDLNAKVADEARLVLPAVKVDQTLESTSKFQSQGKKDVGAKAAGSIVIYNFTGQTLNLKAATTILTAGNKSYTLAQDAMQIKPTKYKDANTKEIDPASLNSPFEIVAQMAGEESNLPAGVRLEIANQIFGSRPQLVYAKTQSPVGGGTSRFLSLVSEADLATAQDQLGKNLLSQVQQALSQNGQQLTENSYRLEVISFVADKPAGTESPSFSATLKARVVGLAFSESALKELLIKRISQNLSENRTLSAGKDFDMVYKIKTIDLNAPAAVLSVHFEGKTLMKVETEKLPGILIGKTKNQARDVLESMPEIERADVTLSPAWQRNFPWFSAKIKVKLAE